MTFATAATTPSTSIWGRLSVRAASAGLPRASPGSSGQRPIWSVSR